jgi:hypothetical protein
MGRTRVGQFQAEISRRLAPTIPRSSESVVIGIGALSRTPMSSMTQCSCTISLGKAVEGYGVLPTAMACPRSSDQPVSVLPLTVMAKMVICASSVDGWPSPSSTSW